MRGERTFGWPSAYRRLARTYERDLAVSEAAIRWPAINVIIRRLARKAPPPDSCDHHQVIVLSTLSERHRSDYE